MLGRIEKGSEDTAKWKQPGSLDHLVEERACLSRISCQLWILSPNYCTLGLCCYNSLTNVQLCDWNWDDSQWAALPGSGEGWCSQVKLEWHAWQAKRYLLQVLHTYYMLVTSASSRAEARFAISKVYNWNNSHQFFSLDHSFPGEKSLNMLDFSSPNYVFF